MMKEFISKNIDILMEEKRFVHTLLVALLSGLAGIVFGIISNKLILDLGIIFLITIGVFILITLIVLKNNISFEQDKFLEQLKDLE